MKFKLLPLGLLSFTALLPFLPSFTAPASASFACTMVDVNTQLAIRGSQTPGSQTNNVGMHDDGSCFAGTVTNTGTQVYAGPGHANQDRSSQQYVSGDPSANPLGLNSPTVRVPVNVQMDVYSPAYNPDFMPSYATLPNSDNPYVSDYMNH